jgi:hypothetical protein
MAMDHSHDQLFPDGQSNGKLRWTTEFDDFVNRTTAYPNPDAKLAGQTLRVPDWCLQPKNPFIDEPERMHPIPGLLTSFDNTPRRPFNTSVIWSAGEPNVVVQRFTKSLTAAIYYETCCVDRNLHAAKDNAINNGDDKMILINAWNEWAEGMALEPSDVFGRRLLEAISHAKNAVHSLACHMTVNNTHDKQ